MTLNGNAGGRIFPTPAAAPVDGDWSFGAWEDSCATRLVRQREKTDCGVACLAMVAGVSYEEAFSTFCMLGLDTKHKNRRFSSNFKDLTLAMLKHGLGCAQRRWAGWSGFSGLGVIKVRVGTKPREWHWVVAESHPQFGFVLRDPDFELAGIARPPDQVLTQDPARYEPYGNWLAVTRSAAGLCEIELRP